ncbi:glycosyltransferase family 39 protein [Argonema galeatum]|uniref:glycosyltransferase family 39 protein n=1 Tax=Argonema galeatum TaxID=2942762 RepID=UPI002011C0F1|nr:glycosyltransferase family 39 protein [Argonema galeatum]MCL1464824.1 glycosyltransferase family 39 protein [Argonema galeatum A003/A1]
MRKTSLILLLWLTVGIGLRFTHLELKSPWTDEFSTMVFSLGNSFRTVPLDRAIALDVLMTPLIPTDAGVGEVIQHLLSESNHPPLYFVLAHLWMKLFPGDGGLVSVWVARSLPAILGAVSIPAIYALGCIAFRSRLVGQLAAAMMAVSPYGIFLAQEARHYTLGILFVIASLACLVVAVRHIWEEKSLPFWFSLAWIAINSLGIASHYFFAFTLCAEGMVLLAFWYWEMRHGKERKNSQSPIQNLKSFVAVTAGTLAGGLVWLPVWQHSYNSELTEWIKNSDRMGWEWLTPIFQAIAAWITMLSLLPVEVTALPIVIASGLVMIIFFLWALPILNRGIQESLTQPTTRKPVLLLGGFVLSSLVLFFSITYFWGIDLTRGARYNFVYFPAVIVLVGASLAQEVNRFWILDFGFWIDPTDESGVTPKPMISWSKVKIKRGKNLFYLLYFNFCIIWLMGFVSAMTVGFNLGYQKYYRPDLLVPVIQQVSKANVLIATTHKTHVQTGEVMGLGWEFKRLANSEIPATPQFILAHKDSKNSTLPTITLQKTLSTLPRPLDLWLVNFHATYDVKSQNCSASSQSLPFVDGYDYQLYHCD